MSDSASESVRKGMPGRLFRLLSLLQARRDWSGAELRGRLGISGRTLRRDIERLRALDYPVISTTGTDGGYRLTSGQSLPPLQLDDEEAVAVAIGLVTAGALPGVGDDALRALAKLQPLLPKRLRPRLADFAGAARAVIPSSGPSTDSWVLSQLASCCRDSLLVGFGYQGRTGPHEERRVEPHHLVTLKGRWYLIAFDPSRDDWRNFRVDRIGDLRASVHRFTPRMLPASDPQTYLTQSFTGASYRLEAHVLVDLDPESLAERMFAPVPGTIEPNGDGASVLKLTAESADLLAQCVASVATLGVRSRIVSASEEVAERVRGASSELASLGTR